MPILPDGRYPVIEERLTIPETLMVRPNPPKKIAGLQRVYLRPPRLPKWFRDVWKSQHGDRSPLDSKRGFTGAADVYALVGRMASAWPTEHFVILACDVKNRPVAVVEITVGTLDAALVHPRDVFAAAVASNAASIILAHNHPSGDPEPSAEDIALTRRLADAGDLMGIPILDHVVLGNKGYVSLAERGVV